MLLGGVFNTIYLWNHCPLDFSEDESHYWEWSRHLDYGYYSKPPGIAWVIWATVRVGHALGAAGGGTGWAPMPVLRMPAVIFAVLSGLLSLFLARRIFRDDRAALAVTLLSAAVPMFAVGSLLLTIDSPTYLCWAATVFCLWRSVEKSEIRNPKSEMTDSRGGGGWIWLAGACCAIGMLFKPVLIALPIFAGIAAWADRRGGRIRRAFATWHSAGAGMLVVLSQVPVVLWNARHDWVTFRHIGAQGGLTGLEERGFNVLKHLEWLGEYVGGQAGGMGGVMFLLLVLAVVVAWREARRGSDGVTAGPEGIADDRTRWVFLLSFAVPLWVFYLLLSLWKKTELNWPAASYFAGMILLSGVVLRQWHSPDARRRRDWRGWTTAAVIWGAALTALLMNIDKLYPLMGPKLVRREPTAIKLRGFEDRGEVVQRAVDALQQETGLEPMVVTNRYDTSSSLSFYMPGPPPHPFVFCIMSLMDRGNQYDLWPGPDERRDGKLVWAGRPAIVVGRFTDEQVKKFLEPAFERLDRPIEEPLHYRGMVIRNIVYYRGYGFRGFPKGTAGKY